MIEWILLLIAIVPHELGHILAYYFLTRKWPDIKLTWFGVLVGDKEGWKLTIIQSYIVLWSGIFTGYLFLWAFGVSREIYLFYFITCSIDITNIIQLLSLPKEYSKKKLNLYQVSELEFKKLKNHVKGEKLFKEQSTKKE